MNNFNFDELKYYAINYDINSQQLRYINVFKVLDSIAFREAVYKYKTITNYEELYRWVSRELKYEYMFKAQYEITVNSIFGGDNPIKIDIWSQIAPNMEYIVDIVNAGFGLNFEKNLNKVKKDLLLIQIEK